MDAHGVPSFGGNKVVPRAEPRPFQDGAFLFPGLQKGSWSLW